NSRGLATRPEPALPAAFLPPARHVRAGEERRFPMGSKAHPLGFCTCKKVLPVWRRSRHWSAQEVSYLEEWYGRMPDERLAEKLGRPVLGIRLKAKRIRPRKRNTALTATRVAKVVAVDPNAASHW